MENYITGKTKERIENYKRQLKKGKVLTLVVFILLILMSSTILIDNNDDMVIAELIVIVIMSLIILSGVLKDMIQLKRLNDDLNNNRYKRLESTYNKPINIKYKIYKPNKSSRRYLKYIKLYYSNVTLILPLEETYLLQTGLFRNLNYRLDLDRCKEKLFNISTSLQYLEKSKVIISGASEYYEIINECIISKLD